MNTNTRIKQTAYIIAMFSAGLFFTGIYSCKNAEKHMPEKNVESTDMGTSEDADKVNREYMEDVENYKRINAERIAANRKSIEEFNARIAKEKKEAREKYEERIAELNEKNTDMEKRLNDFRADSKENWEKFKVEFNHDMDELGQAFKDLTVDNVRD